MTKTEKGELEFEYRYGAGCFDAAAVREAAAHARRAAGVDEPPVRMLLVNRIFSPPPGSAADMVRLREYRTGRVRQPRCVLTAKVSLERLASAGHPAEFEKEVETPVDDGAAAATLLEMLGCTRRHTLEKIRERIALPFGGEIAFDESPGLPPLMEVEARSLRDLNRLVRMLGLAPPKKQASLEAEYAEHCGIAGLGVTRRIVDAAGGADNELTFASAGGVLRSLVPAGAALRKFDARLRKQRAEARRLR